MKVRPPRFTLGSLLLLCAIIAMGIGWWLDHARLERELNNAQTRLEARELLAKAREPLRAFAGGYNPQGFGGVSQPTPPNPYPTPGEFIEALRFTSDFDQWQEAMVIFAATEVADEALPSLIKLCKDLDPEVRSRAIYTLGCMARQEETVVPAAIRLLDDKDSNVRWHAAFALGDYFGPKSRSALPALQNIIESESSPISAFAAGMAFKIDPSIDVEPRLQEFLRTGDAETRMRAVESLRTISYATTISKSTEDALLEAFRDSDESLKRIIAQLLEQIEGGPQSSGTAKR
jgi:hypothetical protein